MGLWILSEVAVVAGFVLAGLAIAHMLRQRRSPQSAIAWLLAIIFLPYVGVPLYLMVGGRKMRRLATEKRQIPLLTEDAPGVDQCPAVARVLAAHGVVGPTGGNRLDLCETGERAYNALIGLIDDARDSLWMTMFILQPDEIGANIARRLARRAVEGVEVRLLLDDWGSLRAKRRLIQPLRDAGVSVAFFMPLIHRPFRARTNLRNHRKIVIADGCRVMCGGLNVGREYMGPTPQPDRWRDLAAILEGPAARQYCEIFRSDWEFAAKEALAPSRAPVKRFGEAMAQVVPSGPDVAEDPLYEAILTVAFEAEKRLWITTPYFIPDDALLQALTLAARRRVDLRIIIPKRSNHPVTDLARGSYLREIQRAGGRILQYAPRMMHAKAMLMDDSLFMVGSANMDMRSLFLNYEAATLVYTQPEIKAAERWMETLIAETEEGIAEPGAARDVIEGVVRMVAPLL